MKRLSLLLVEPNSLGVQAVIRDVADGCTDPMIVGVRCEEHLADLPSHFMFLNDDDIETLCELVRPHLAPFSEVDQPVRPIMELPKVA